MVCHICTGIPTLMLLTKIDQADEYIAKNLAEDISKVKLSCYIQGDMKVRFTLNHDFSKNFGVVKQGAFVQCC